MQAQGYFKFPSRGRWQVWCEWLAARSVDQYSECGLNVTQENSITHSCLSLSLSPPTSNQPCLSLSQPAVRSSLNPSIPLSNVHNTLAHLTKSQTRLAYFSHHIMRNMKICTGSFTLGSLVALAS